MITLVIDNSLDGNSKKVDCQHVKSAKFVRDEAIFTKKNPRKTKIKFTCLLPPKINVSVLIWSRNYGSEPARRRRDRSPNKLGKSPFLDLELSRSSDFGP